MYRQKNYGKQKIGSALLGFLLFCGFVVAVFPATTTAEAATDPNSFSIMQISDTQFLAQSFPQLFTDTTNWIVNNAANYNLKMVIHTGDLVDNINGTSGTYSDPVQWNNANSAMSLLLNAAIPYCWDAGNHDQIPWNNASATWLGSNYPAFNASNMRSKPYWVSDFADSKNTAAKFTFNGYGFLIINLEYMASNTTIAWMKTLLDNNKAANVIIAAHTYLNKAGGYGFSSAGLPGEVAWCNNFKTILDTYPNVFLTLSGHDPTGTANMTKVGSREEIFFNRQSATTTSGQTGAAAVRIYTFNLASKEVSTSTYSLDTQTWLTTATNQFSFSAALKSDPQYDWVLVNEARSVKAYPALQEYVWQKNATMPPNGQYDKIALHRIVNSATTPRGVIFINPGTYGNGEQLTSNPPTDNYTKYENNTLAYYWANRGFDVYALDYRTHFVPQDLNSSQLGFMANWGWDQWINDIKEGVTKAKEVSGAKKVFMTGFSLGGFATMNYATKYGQEDLRGIILLDGGWTAKNQNYNSTNTYNLTNTLNLVAKSGVFGYEFPNLPGLPTSPPGAILTLQYALQNPDAAALIRGTNQSLPPTINPLTNKTWTNITEWYTVTQSGPFNNILGGYANATISLRQSATNDRYWPKKIYVELGAYNDWNNCPDLAFDFDDHYKDINVPLIDFSSQLFGVPTFGIPINGIASSDYTSKILSNYGHTDVIVGTYSVRDVSQPILDWMLSRYQAPAASAFGSVTVMAGQTWYFFAHSSSNLGTCTYQWYEGTTLLTGQTSMVLPIAKTAAGTYTYTCKIKDNEGTTANSNTVTLTVINK
jgi:dienelactone hydrolase